MLLQIKSDFDDSFITGGITTMWFTVSDNLISSAEVKWATKLTESCKLQLVTAV